MASRRRTPPTLADRQAEQFRALFATLERAGQLQPILSAIRVEIAHDEQALRVLLRTVLITDAEKLARVHALQGRLSAYAHQLVKWKQLGRTQILPGDQGEKLPVEADDTGTVG